MYICSILFHLKKFENNYNVIPYIKYYFTMLDLILRKLKQRFTVFV